MKRNNMGVIVPVLIGVVLILNGVTYADQPVPAVPETQGLVTATGADVVGMATETDTLAWTLTNDPWTLDVFQLPPGLAFLNSMIQQLIAAGGTYNGYTLTIPVSILDHYMAPGVPDTWNDFRLDLLEEGATETILAGGIHTGGLDPEQIQYTTAYDAHIVAQGGHTVLLKSIDVNTGNKVLTQSNLKAHTGLTYIATSDGGNVVGSENLLLDGAGNTTHASDRMLCPFVPTKAGNVIPAYCNIVQTGNAYDLTVGSVTSDMSERFVGTDAAIPVQLDHAFNVKPYGTSDGSIPAMGSSSAYLKVHIQEARGYNYTFVPIGEGLAAIVETSPPKAEDLQYSESSSASGVIRQFTKEIHYQSGRLLLP